MSDVFQKGCLLQLNSSCWTGSKALEPSTVKKLGESGWLRGKKHLVDPEYLGPIKGTIQKARKHLYKLALPFPLTAMTLVPKENVTAIESGLVEIQSEFLAKTEEFARVYESARHEAHKVLGSMFNPTDYPADIRGRFKFEWRYLVLSLPSQTEVLTPDIYAQEVQKFDKLVDEARHLAMLALREEFAGLVNHLVSRLSNNGSKPKILKCSMVENINEFLESFRSRDMFEDLELQMFVKHAGDIISTIESPFALKYDEGLRDTVREKMNALKLEIDDSITTLDRFRHNGNARIDQSI